MRLNRLSASQQQHLTAEMIEEKEAHLHHLIASQQQRLTAETVECLCQARETDQQ